MIEQVSVDYRRWCYVKKGPIVTEMENQKLQIYFRHLAHAFTADVTINRGFVRLFEGDPMKKYSFHPEERRVPQEPTKTPPKYDEP